MHPHPHNGGGGGASSPASWAGSPSSQMPAYVFLAFFLFRVAPPGLVHPAGLVGGPGASWKAPPRPVLVSLGHIRMHAPRNACLPPRQAPLSSKLAVAARPPGEHSRTPSSSPPCLVLRALVLFTLIPGAWYCCSRIQALPSCHHVRPLGCLLWPFLCDASEPKSLLPCLL